MPFPVLHNLVTGPNGPLRVRNDGAPCEGAKVYLWSVLFQAIAGPANSVDLDLSDAVSQGIIHGVEGFYIENSMSTPPGQPLTLFCYSTQQTIVIPYNSRGFYPCLLVNAPKWALQNPAGSLGTVKIWACNFPVNPFVSALNVGISSNGPGVQLFDLHGSLQVVDNASTRNSESDLLVSTRWQGSADVYYNDRRGNRIYNGSIATVAGLVLVVGNPSYFITEFDVKLSANVSQLVAGPLQITIQDTSTVLAQLFPYVPAAAAGGVGYINILHLDNLNFFSSVNGSNLAVYLGNALVTGTCTVTACGGTTATLGV